MTSGDHAVADGFDVAPAALAGAAGAFDVEADAVDAGVAALTARLDALGACWGDDAVGSRFGPAYQDVGFVALDNLEAVAIGARRIAAALRAVAHAYEVADRVLEPDSSRVPSVVLTSRSAAPGLSGASVER